MSVICILLSFAGCKPKYVRAESIDAVYSMALKEMENAKTKQEMTLVNLKIQNEILKAILWYQDNDRNNPRLKQLDEMLKIIKE